MGRLTVRLPQTLHEQLVQLAHQEGVSLNQYILYALARQAAVSEPEATSEPAEEAARQREAFAALRRQSEEASLAEVQAVFAAHTPVEPEAVLSPAVRQRLQAQIVSKQRLR